LIKRPWSSIQWKQLQQQLLQQLHQPVKSDNSHAINMASHHHPIGSHRSLSPTVATESSSHVAVSINGQAKHLVADRQSLLYLSPSQIYDDIIYRNSMTQGIVDENNENSAHYNHGLIDVPSINNSDEELNMEGEGNQIIFVRNSSRSSQPIQQSSSQAEMQQQLNSILQLCQQLQCQLQQQQSQ
jgi:hypothetical protein